MLDRSGLILAREPYDPDIVGQPLPDGHYLRPFVGARCPAPRPATARTAAPGCSGTRHWKARPGPPGAVIVVGIPEWVAFEDVNRITREHICWRSARVIVLALLAAWLGGERLVVGMIRQSGARRRADRAGRPSGAGRPDGAGGELGGSGRRSTRWPTELEARDRERARRALEADVSDASGPGRSPSETSASNRCA